MNNETYEYVSYSLERACTCQHKERSCETGWHVVSRFETEDESVRQAKLCQEQTSVGYRVFIETKSRKPVQF